MISVRPAVRGRIFQSQNKVADRSAGGYCRLAPRGLPERRPGARGPPAVRPSCFRSVSNAGETPAQQIGRKHSSGKWNAPAGIPSDHADGHAGGKNGVVTVTARRQPGPATEKVRPTNATSASRYASAMPAFRRGEKPSWATYPISLSPAKIRPLETGSSNFKAMSFRGDRFPARPGRPRGQRTPLCETDHQCSPACRGVSPRRQSGSAQRPHFQTQQRVRPGA